MKYLNLARQNLRASDPEIAQAAIRFIEAADIVEQARAALDRANERLLDRQGEFLALIGQ